MELDGMNSTRIGTIITRLSEDVMQLDGVEGLYEGESEDGKPRIVIMIAVEDAALRKRLPSHIDDIPIEIEITGKLKPL